MAEKKELVEKLSKLNADLEDIKQELNKINEKKESAYQKKREVGKEIADTINQLTDSKKKRNTFTDKVRELKKQRDTLNKEISKEIEEIKALKEEHKKSSQNAKSFKGNPVRLLKQIEELEFKMQTTPMEFSKEKALNKKIKDLKKEASGMKRFNDLWKIIKVKSKHIDKLKSEANKLHAELRGLAERSQERHEEMIDVSEGVDSLRKAEEDSYQEFLKFKNEYNDINERFKLKMSEIREIRKELGEDVKEKKRQKKEQEVQTLKEREQIVKEKFKTGGKLTTEDLLVFQRLDDDDIFGESMKTDAEKKESAKSKKEEKAAPKKVEKKPAAKKTPAKKAPAKKKTAAKKKAPAKSKK